MKKLILSFASLGLIFAMACGSDDSDPANNAPDAFTVTISDITATEVTISWSVVEDQDGDDVTYDLYLDGQSVETGIEIPSGFSGIDYGISELTPETLYTGMVTADDGNEGTTDASFSFTTEASPARN